MKDFLITYWAEQNDEPTDIEIIIQCERSAAGQLGIRFNNDTSFLYSTTYAYGNGTTATSGRTGQGSFSFIDFGYTQGGLGIQTYKLSLTNYANTTTFKTLLGRQSYVGGDVLMEAGLYGSTNAISRIDFVTSSGNYNTGSTFALYGILAA